MTIQITGKNLTLNDIAACFAGPIKAKLTQEAKDNMTASVKTVEKVVNDNQTCYGINTGFGHFANTQISAEQVAQLQVNLVRSHTTGIGEPLSAGLTRAIMLMKANSLSQGFSGIRAEVVETMLDLLSADVLPVIPCKGSVGASGDLAPLAHLALALIGEGEAMQDGKRLAGIEVLKAVNRDAVALQAKEGLALLNGTQVSAALAMQATQMTRTLLESAVTIGALSVEAVSGSYTPFDERIHSVRNLSSQQRIAKAFRQILTGSEIQSSHEDCDRVQDPYAFRCMPQVYGAVLSTLEHAESVLVDECNSVSDNPLIFEDDVLSGGNFHAAPLGFVSDFLAVALCEIGNISERRSDCLVRKVNPNLSMFLTQEAGLESGLMIAHVTAAALASENKTLAHPSSVDTIPTSAGQEDHVSMAPWAGRKAIQIAENVANILAVELLCVARSHRQLAPLKTTRELQPYLANVEKGLDNGGDQRFDIAISTLASKILANKFNAQLL